MNFSPKFFFFRYFTYVFIAIEILLIPVLLKNELYGEIELYKSIALLGPYALLGSFSGYMYDVYTLKKESYQHLFIWGFFSSLLVGFAYAFWYSSYLIMIPFILNALSIIQEKKIQIAGHFLLSILFKPLLSLFLVCIIFVLHSFSFPLNNVLHSLVISYLLAYTIWTILCVKLTKIEVLVFRTNNIKDSLKIYSRLVLKGFTINFSSILLSLLIFNYRIFISESFSIDLSSFSLAFNFAQFIFVGVNTIGYMLTVKIGENIDNVTINFLLKSMLKTTFFFSVLFLAGLIVVFLYGYYVKKFDNLIEYYLILSLFIGAYYVLSVISPVLLYRDTINNSTLMLLIIFVIDYLSTKYLVQLEYSSFTILIKSGILLLFSGLYNLYLIFFKSSISR